MELICQLKEIYKALYAYEKQFSDQTGITINEAGNIISSTLCINGRKRL